MKRFKTRSYIKITAVTSVVAGLLVIIGWMNGIESLKSVVPGLAPMKFNTAICFILFGVALYILIKNNKNGFRFQIPILLIVALLALITFCEYAFKFNSGLDELFVKDYSSKGGALDFPGRMAAPTAISFLLMSVSLIAINSARNGVKLLAQYLLHFITFISFIVLMGYLYNLPTFYRLSLFSSMALNTSGLFFLLSIAASLINPSLGIISLLRGKSTGSIMARRLFPRITIIILVMGFIRMQIHKLNILSENFGVAVFVTSTILVCLFLIAMTAMHLDKIDAERRAAEESLRSFNIHLQELVDKRTADLQQTTERLSLATQGSQIGIWDLDMISNKITLDERMYKLYGLAPGSFSDASAWASVVHPDDREPTQQVVNKAITGENEFSTEFRVIWPDKSVHHIKAKGFIQRNAAGKAIRMIGTNWDITERIMLQKKLEDQKEQNQKLILITAIESQEKERKQIGFELSENVNQILTAANMHLGLIKARTDRETLEFLDEVSMLIKKAMEGIHKITYNIGNSYIEDIGLEEALEDLVYKMNALRVFKVELKLSIDGLKIPAPVQLTIYRFIQQQLNNILNYAEASNVIIQLHPEGDRLVLDIKDDGKGIDPAEIKTNKGLSIMKSRAKAYNGEVEIDTSPGKGFKVLVKLPMLQAEK